MASILVLVVRFSRSFLLVCECKNGGNSRRTGGKRKGSGFVEFFFFFRPLLTQQFRLTPPFLCPFPPRTPPNKLRWLPPSVSRLPQVRMLVSDALNGAIRGAPSPGARGERSNEKGVKRESSPLLFALALCLPQFLSSKVDSLASPFRLRFATLAPLCFPFHASRRCARVALVAPRGEQALRRDFWLATKLRKEGVVDRAPPLFLLLLRLFFLTLSPSRAII